MGPGYHYCAYGTRLKGGGKVHAPLCSATAWPLNMPLTWCGCTATWPKIH